MPGCREVAYWCVKSLGWSRFPLPKIQQDFPTSNDFPFVPGNWWRGTMIWIPQKHFPYGNDPLVWITSFSCFAYINGATLIIINLHYTVLCMADGVHRSTTMHYKSNKGSSPYRPKHRQVTLDFLNFRCRLECSHWSDIRCVELAEGESFSKAFCVFQKFRCNT